MSSIVFHSIGRIRTPYLDIAPFKQDDSIEGEFYVELDRQYLPGLYKLEQFSHLIVLFYFDRTKKVNIIAHPPNYEGKSIGLFASRSPFRPNHIGMDTVKILEINDNRIHTSHMDILDNTPLIDLKPYVPRLDKKENASSGWMRK